MEIVIIMINLLAYDFFIISCFLLVFVYYFMIIVCILVY